MLLFNFLLLFYLMVPIDNYTISKNYENKLKYTDINDRINDLDYNYLDNHNKYKYRRISERNDGQKYSIHSRYTTPISYRSVKRKSRDFWKLFKKSKSNDTLSNNLNKRHHKENKGRYVSIKDLDNYEGAHNSIILLSDKKDTKHERRFTFPDKNKMRTLIDRKKRNTTDKSKINPKSDLLDEKSLFNFVSKEAMEKVFEKYKHMNIEDFKTDAPSPDIAKSNISTHTVKHLLKTTIPETLKENTFEEVVTEASSSPEDEENDLNLNQMEQLLGQIKHRALEMVSEQNPNLQDIITNAATETAFNYIFREYDHLLRKREYDVIPSITPMVMTAVSPSDKTTKKNMFGDNLTHMAEFSISGSTTLEEDIQRELKAILRILKCKYCNLKPTMKCGITKAKDFIGKTTKTIRNKIADIIKPKKYCTKPMLLEKIGSTLISTTTSLSSPQTPFITSVSLSVSPPVLSTTTTPIPLMDKEGLLDNHFPLLNLIENVLSKSDKHNLMTILSSTTPARRIDKFIKIMKRNSNPEHGKVKSKRHSPIKRRNNLAFNNLMYNTVSNSESEPTTYDSLSKKLSYKEYVNGYKHYLDFQKKQSATEDKKFSNLVRYQAHKHHSVDSIGKNILNKIPPMPDLGRNKRKHIIDDAMDDQEQSTKTDDSWFKKHFYIFIDRGPPKKYHTSQTVSLKTVPPVISLQNDMAKDESPDISKIMEQVEDQKRGNIDEMSKALDNMENTFPTTMSNLMYRTSTQTEETGANDDLIFEITANNLMSGISNVNPSTESNQLSNKRKSLKFLFGRNSVRSRRNMYNDAMTEDYLNIYNRVTRIPSTYMLGNTHFSLGKTTSKPTTPKIGRVKSFFRKFLKHKKSKTTFSPIQFSNKKLKRESDRGQRASFKNFNPLQKLKNMFMSQNENVIVNDDNLNLKSYESKYDFTPDIEKIKKYWGETTEAWNITDWVAPNSTESTVTSSMYPIDTSPSLEESSTSNITQSADTSETSIETSTNSAVTTDNAIYNIDDEQVTKSLKETEMKKPDSFNWNTPVSSVDTPKIEKEEMTTHNITSTIASTDHTTMTSTDETPIVSYKTPIDEYITAFKTLSGQSDYAKLQLFQIDEDKNTRTTNDRSSRPSSSKRNDILDDIYENLSKMLRRRIKKSKQSILDHHEEDDRDNLSTKPIPDLFNDLLMWHKDILYSNELPKGIQGQNMMKSLKYDDYPTASYDIISEPTSNKEKEVEDLANALEKFDSNSYFNMTIIPEKIPAQGIKVLKLPIAEDKHWNDEISKRKIEIKSLDDLAKSLDKFEDNLYGINLMSLVAAVSSFPKSSTAGKIERNARHAAKIKNHHMKNSMFDTTHSHSKINTTPKQFFSIPFPMGKEEFNKFLKENDMDLESVMTPNMDVNKLKDSLEIKKNLMYLPPSKTRLEWKSIIDTTTPERNLSIDKPLSTESSKQEHNTKASFKQHQDSYDDDQKFLNEIKAQNPVEDNKMDNIFKTNNNKIMFRNKRFNQYMNKDISRRHLLNLWKSKNKNKKSKTKCPTKKHESSNFEDSFTTVSENTSPISTHKGLDENNFDLTIIDMDDLETSSKFTNLPISEASTSNFTSKVKSNITNIDNTNPKDKVDGNTNLAMDKSLSKPSSVPLEKSAELITTPKSVMSKYTEKPSSKALLDSSGVTSKVKSDKRIPSKQDGIMDTIFKHFAKTTKLAKKTTTKTKTKTVKTTQESLTSTSPFTQLSKETTTVNHEGYKDKYSEVPATTTDSAEYLPKKVLFSSHALNYNIIYATSPESNDGNVTSTSRHNDLSKASDFQEMIQIIKVVEAVDNITRPNVMIYIDLPTYYEPIKDITITEAVTPSKPQWSDIILKYITGIALFELLTKFGIIKDSGLNIADDSEALLKGNKYFSDVETSSETAAAGNGSHRFKRGKRGNRRRNIKPSDTAAIRPSAVKQYSDVTEATTTSLNLVNTDTTQSSTLTSRAVQIINEDSKQETQTWFSNYDDGEILTEAANMLKFDSPSLGEVVSSTVADKLKYIANHIFMTHNIRTIDNSNHTAIKMIKRDAKRHVESETYTAKNVAALEVVVDLMKSAKEEHVNSLRNHNFVVPNSNNEDGVTNSVLVHIAVPYQLDKKRSISFEKIKEVFSAKMMSPVDIEYQIHSYQEPYLKPTTVRNLVLQTTNIIEPGDKEKSMYSLKTSNNKNRRVSQEEASMISSTSNKPEVAPGIYALVEEPGEYGSFILKPIRPFDSNDLRPIETGNIGAGSTAEASSPISTAQVLSTDSPSTRGRVTLSKEFITDVNKHLISLYEAFESLKNSENVHNITARSPTTKHRNKRFLDTIKKILGHDRVCSCNLKENRTMSRACAASDQVMSQLIYEFNNLAEYMEKHCTEIQTYFWMNPSGGRKLRELVRRIDKNMNDYYKRVRGKCQGQTCNKFTGVIDKRSIRRNNIDTETYIQDYLLNDVEKVSHDLKRLTKYKRTPICSLFDSGYNFLAKMSDCLTEKPHIKRSPSVKTVYALDGINVNIVCQKTTEDELISFPTSTQGYNLRNEIPVSIFYFNPGQTNIPYFTNTTQKYDTNVVIESMLNYISDPSLTSYTTIMKENKDIAKAKKKNILKRIIESYQKKKKSRTTNEMYIPYKKREVRNPIETDSSLITNNTGSFWYNYIKRASTNPFTTNKNYTENHTEKNAINNMSAKLNPQKLLIKVFNPKSKNKCDKQSSTKASRSHLNTTLLMSTLNSTSNLKLTSTVAFSTSNAHATESMGKPMNISETTKLETDIIRPNTAGITLQKHTKTITHPVTNTTSKPKSTLKTEIAQNSIHNLLNRLKQGTIQLFDNLDKTINVTYDKVTDNIKFDKSTIKSRFIRHEKQSSKDIIFNIKTTVCPPELKNNRKHTKMKTKTKNKPHCNTHKKPKPIIKINTSKPKLSKHNKTLSKNFTYYDPEIIDMDSNKTSTEPTIVIINEFNQISPIIEEHTERSKRYKDLTNDKKDLLMYLIDFKNKKSIEKYNEDLRNPDITVHIYAQEKPVLLIQNRVPSAMSEEVKYNAPTLASNVFVTRNSPLVAPEVDEVGSITENFVVTHEATATTGDNVPLDERQGIENTPTINNIIVIKPIMAVSSTDAIGAIEPEIYTDPTTTTKTVDSVKSLKNMKATKTQIVRPLLTDSTMSTEAVDHKKPDNTMSTKTVDMIRPTMSMVDSIDMVTPEIGTYSTAAIENVDDFKPVMAKVPTETMDLKLSVATAKTMDVADLISDLKERLRHEHFTKADKTLRHQNCHVVKRVVSTAADTELPGSGVTGDTGTVIVAGQPGKQHRDWNRSTVTPTVTHTVAWSDPQTTRRLSKPLNRYNKIKFNNKQQKYSQNYINNTFCDLDETFVKVNKMYNRLNKKEFENYAKNITCYEHKTIPKCWIIDNDKIMKCNWKNSIRNKFNKAVNGSRIKWKWNKPKRSLLSIKKYDYEDNDQSENFKENQNVIKNNEYRNRRSIDDGFEVFYKGGLIPNTFNKILKKRPRRKVYSVRPPKGACFERFYRDDYGIYRQEKTRRKRGADDVKMKLKHQLMGLPAIKVPENEIYAMLGETIKLDCTLKTLDSPLRNLVSLPSTLRYSWTVDRDEMLTYDNVDVGVDSVKVTAVGTRNVGEYACSKASTELTKIRLQVVTLPTLRVAYLAQYGCSVCNYNDLKSMEELGKILTSEVCGKGKFCEILVEDPMCLQNRENKSSSIQVTAVLSSTFTPRVACGVECQRDIHCGMAYLAAVNIPVSFSVPVMLLRDGENKTFTPCPNMKGAIVTHTLRRKRYICSLLERSHRLAVSDWRRHRAYRAMTSAASGGDVTLVTSCPAGYYLLQHIKICLACPKDTFSREGDHACRACPPGHGSPPGAGSCVRSRLRRCDEWWRRYGRALGAALGAAWAAAGLAAAALCLARARARPHAGGAGLDDKAHPSAPPGDAGPPARRPRSPSRLLLARLFRGSPSSLSKGTDSQETKFGLWRERTISSIPPPLPPIDFDVELS